jgi:Ca2+-binding RTX toxin-like protein
VENLILSGSAAINGTGNALANSITGNAGANFINAGAGNDTVNAGTGVDRVTGGAGSDLLSIDWRNFSGANITNSVSLDGGTGIYKGTYTAKNSSGAVLSSVDFDGIEQLNLNGNDIDLKALIDVPAGVTIKRLSNGTTTTEQGGVVEYSVVLNKAPRYNVTVNFTGTDSTEGKVNTPSLTFTAANWSTPQVLTIQGVDDYLDDGNVAFSVNGKIVTDDLNYNRITIPAINLINNDDGEDTPLNIQGTPGVDYLTGMNGDDRIYGAGNQDEIRGGRGNDRIYGEQDDDRLFGEEGNDKLYGGYDDDTLDGGNGNDELYGEQGLDTLLGGAGNDILDGGIEADSMVGGTGNDTYYVDNAGDKINDLGATTDVDTVIVTQTITYTLAANIENASVTSTAGNGNLTGNALNNGLTGNDGRNVLNGGTGNDSLDGGAGSDSLLGGTGNDAFEGGAGNDTMRGGEGVDVADFVAAGLDISIDLTTGRATGDGTDLIFDIENILTGEGDDKLTGSAGANDLDGGAGTDSLNGGAGNDTLAGCFFGANGGGNEIDTLVGGSGADLFQLGWSGGRFYDDGTNSNAGRTNYALITDFTVGTDRLQLDGSASGYYIGASGVTGVSGEGLWAEQGATDELIAIIRSANTTALNAANIVNTGLFADNF